MLAFSLAVSQREDWDRSQPMNVKTGVTLVSPVSSITTGGATTTVSPSPKPTSTGEGIPLPIEVDCLDRSRASTMDAWMQEGGWSEA